MHSKRPVWIRRSTRCLRAAPRSSIYKTQPSLRKPAKFWPQSKALNTSMVQRTTVRSASQRPKKIYGVQPAVRDGEEGYSFSGTKGGPVTAAALQTGGSHGYLASDPALHPIFIASGRGVRKGIKLGLVSNQDIASTIAKLLGVQLPTSKGKPIPLQ